jgi:hypothetical protein
VKSNKEAMHVASATQNAYPARQQHSDIGNDDGEVDGSPPTSDKPMATTCAECSTLSSANGIDGTERRTRSGWVHGSDHDKLVSKLGGVGRCRMNVSRHCGTETATGLRSF